LRNCFCRKYVRGNGLSVFDPLNPTDIDEYVSKHQINHDVFFAPIPANYRSPSYILDISGSFHSAHHASLKAQRCTQYPSAQIMSATWGFKHVDPNPTSTAWKDEKALPKYNTLCFQASQDNYDHARKAWSARTVSRGHFGPNEYDGVRDVRDGYGHYIAPIANGTNMIGIST